MENHNVSMAAEPLNTESPSFVPKEIIITILNYGYQVRVGCQTFAFENEQIMLNNIKKYLKNPQKVIDQWFKTKKIPTNK